MARWKTPTSRPPFRLPRRGRSTVEDSSENTAAPPADLTDDSNPTEQPKNLRFPEGGVFGPPPRTTGAPDQHKDSDPDHDSMLDEVERGLRFMGREIHSLGLMINEALQSRRDEDNPFDDDDPPRAA